VSIERCSEVGSRIAEQTLVHDEGDFFLADYDLDHGVEGVAAFLSSDLAGFFVVKVVFGKFTD